MSLTTEALRELVALGLSAEQVLRVAEANEGEKTRSAGAIRQARYRARQAEKEQGDVTSDVTCDASPVTPPPLAPSPQTPQPHTPPPGEQSRTRKGRALAKPEMVALVDRIWQLQPVTGGKRKATRPDVERSLRSALDRGGEPDDIVAALSAYYRLPDCRKDEGRFASGAAVMLNADRWRDFLPSAAPAAPAGPTDPAVLARRMRHFRDTGVWEPGWGPRPDRPAQPANTNTPSHPPAHGEQAA